MPTFRQLTILGLSATAIVSLIACGDSDETGSGGAGSTSTSTTVATTTTGGGGDATTTTTTTTGGGGGMTTGTGGGGGGVESAKSRGYFFSQDTTNNKWVVTVVDPTAADPIVATLEIDELNALSGPSGNSAGPSWGDSISSPDGTRVFANAGSVDRVLVIETATPSVEVVLAGGKKPIHIYNPNDNNEIWSHNDTDGSFSVIDIDTLAVSAPVVVGLKGTGHGKLNYSKELGTQYFATNTNDPGAWEVNGATKVASFIALCDQPCVDDLATAEDESLTMCGGTHDKTYDPGTNTAIFQCSGATAGHVAYVDGTTKMVEQNMVPMVVSAFAYTHDKSYNLVYDNAIDTVNVWDNKKAGHSLEAFDATLTITGNASGRGTDFYHNDADETEAYIPASIGTMLTIVNLKTMARTDLDIGTLSPPPGGSSVTRRGAIAGDWYYTNNDSNLVMVNVKTHAIVKAAQPAGYITRINGAMVP